MRRTEEDGGGRRHDRSHGITPMNWTTVAAELQRDWTLPTGKDLGRVFHDHYHSYGLLMDSFESKTAKAGAEGVLRALFQTID